MHQRRREAKSPQRETAEGAAEERLRVENAAPRAELERLRAGYKGPVDLRPERRRRLRNQSQSNSLWSDQASANRITAGRTIRDLWPEEVATRGRPFFSA